MAIRKRTRSRRLIPLRPALCPAALWNPRLYDRDGAFIAIPDAWFDEVAMAWEIDSKEWHLSPEDYAATVQRRTRMMAAGVIVVQRLPSALRLRPAAVLGDLQANLAHAAVRPRPSLRAVAAAPP